MLSPTDSTLLRIVQERGLLSSSEMTELVNYKLKRAPQRSLRDLIVERGLLSPDRIAELTAATERGDSRRFSPVSGAAQAQEQQARLLYQGPPSHGSFGASAHRTTAPGPSPKQAPELSTSQQRPPPAAPKPRAHWPLQSGDRLGNYVVKDLLGKGGMGQVFRVHHERLEKDYALKVLLPSSAENPRLRHRFRHEARATARLRHPNIIAVHEVGEELGIHYFTMDLIEGLPLDKLLKTRRLSVEETCQLLRKIATALHHAHREGVIHRDLKPSNIIVADDGEPFLMDFGLAKELHAQTQLTRTGTAVGTLAFMPPEQLQGRKDLVGPRSDIYSLGVTMYECLTGALPFVAESAPSLIAKVINEDATPPMQKVADVPKPASVICMKAMSKELGFRYPTALDMCRDIERFLDGEPIDARATGIIQTILNRARRNKPAAALALTLILLLCGIATWWAVGEVRARLAYSAGLEQAEGAAASKDWSRAMGLYGELIGQDPSRPEAYAGLEQAREALAARNVAEAARQIDEGRRHLVNFARLTTVITADEATVRTLGADVTPTSSLADKSLLYRVRGTLRSRRREALQLRAQAIACFHRARGLDPGNAEARRLLVELYRAELAEAEEAGDSERLPFYRAMLEGLGERLDVAPVPGRLEVVSEPREAGVFLFRLEDDPATLRRTPRPFHPDPDAVSGGSRAAAWSAHPEELPLPVGPGNLLGNTPLQIDLPPGNYLLVLRHLTARDTRVPVVVRSGGEHTLRVPLRGATALGEEFVYIPPATVSLGGDREARLGREPRTVELDGFAIGRTEVTRAEYLRFLASELPDGADSDALLPRVGGWRWAGSWSHEGDGRLPVSGLSHGAAIAYCTWRSLDEGRRYRLPTADEWELAARGADARAYVWGDLCEPSYTLSGFLAPADRALLPVGSLPQDCSVYGVLDLNGSVREHVAGSFHPQALPLYGSLRGSWVELRGAGFQAFVGSEELRLASRTAVLQERAGDDFGLRLVREID